MIGAELTRLDTPTMELLTKEPLYRMMNEITESSETYHDDEFVIWEAKSDSKKYAAIFNISDEAKNAPVTSTDIKFDKDYDGALEIWTWKNIKIEEGEQHSTGPCKRNTGSPHDDLMERLLSARKEN